MESHSPERDACGKFAPTALIVIVMVVMVLCNIVDFMPETPAP